MKTWHKWALFGTALAAGVGVLIWDEKKAHAAPNKPPPPPPVCPDGTPAPGGDVTKCPAPKMGNNDPDAPPGGWQYNGAVSNDVLAAAEALAAVDPCQKQNEQLVRNFQLAAGLAQNGQTDGRYGGDAYKAMQQYVANPPAPCYSNSNPSSRPAWWGPPGTYTNP